MPARRKPAKKTKPAAAKKKASAKRPAKVAAPKKAAKAPKRSKVRAKAQATSSKGRSGAKPKAKTGASKRASSATSKAQFPRRRDATGHLDPRYAAELRAKGLEMHDDDEGQQAFLRRARSRDDLAEELGEEAVAEMTSGEDQRESLLDVQNEAETGGPFVGTPGRVEFARGTDESNPSSATREPFPRT